MAQHPVTTALHSLKNTTNSPTVYCSMPDHAFTQKMKKDRERWRKTIKDNEDTKRQAKDVFVFSTFVSKNGWKSDKIRWKTTKNDKSQMKHSSAISDLIPEHYVVAVNRNKILTQFVNLLSSSRCWCRPQWPMRCLSLCCVTFDLVVFCRLSSFWLSPVLWWAKDVYRQSLGVFRRLLGNWMDASVLCVSHHTISTRAPGLLSSLLPTP